MIFKLNNTEFTMNSDEITIKGKHNTYNSMAAGIASKLNDIRDEMIRERFQDFQGVEHRLENFIKVKGIQFINDSKATNINSVWYALDSMKSNNVIWIVGGQDKGNDYEELMELVKEKVKVIVCLGADNTKIMNAFEGVKDIFDTHNVDDAVKTAYFMASDGDIVLLSPACASFDLFKNYEDRGRKFKEAVRNL
jgi:UDP-N-acetylmuramoylalanine--D-glutamate ligase